MCVPDGLLLDNSPALDPPIVAIGASAEGAASIGSFVRLLGVDLDAAIILRAHADPKSRPPEPSIYGDLRVLDALDGMRVEPRTVYVVPAGADLRFDGEHLSLRSRPPDDATGLPTDRLFQALAGHRGSAAVGVVLSGTGWDGALGLRAIQGSGGLALAQDPAEANPSEMSTHAIESGGVDEVLRLADLATRVRQWLAHPVVQAVEPSPLDGTGDRPPEAFEAIVTYTGATLRRDLRVYKGTTVRRRILRRMALLGIDTPAAYLAYLGHHEEEPALLAEQLLVGVTEFFRDPATFAALGAELDARIDRSGVDEVRAWVPGCASGEEAYSIAIMLAERLPRATDFRVFATDLSSTAMARARLGVYPGSIALSVGPERLARFFTPEGDHYAVRPWLRERVTFARHDLICDPPFSRMDLVSCRNLLIYLEPAAQQRVAQLFHFALVDLGLLLLGSAENPPLGVTGLFETVDRTHRLFRRAHTESDSPSGPLYAPTPLDGGPVIDERRWYGQGHRTVIERLILEVSVEAAVLVDQRLSVLYSHGHVERYLRYPRGAPSNRLSGALPNPGAARIRAAVQAVLAGQSGSVTVEVPGHRGERVQVQVIGATLDEQPQALLCFRPSDTPGPTPMAEGEAELTAELDRIERVMSVLVEQLQASNEDLRASHEEVLSMNEELTTVNGQLQTKLREVEEVNADLTNFVEAGLIATIFLDRDLRIRRFTPESCQIFRLVAGDVGRPLSDIRHALLDIDLDRVIADVVERGALVEREATTAAGQWYLVRVLPYRIRSLEDITGVMLTLVDITPQKVGEQEALAYQRRLRFALEDSAITAFVQDRELRYLEVVHSPRPAAEIGLRGRDDDGLDLGHDGPALRAFKRRVLDSGAPGRARFRVDLLATGEPRLYDVRARRFGEPDDRLMVVAIDITDSADEQTRLHHDAETQLSRELSKNYLESLGLLAGGVAHDFNNHLMVIQGSLDLMRETGEAAPDVLADVDEAMSASRQLIAQILAFAQSEPVPAEAVSLGEVTRHTVALLGPMVPPDIEVVLERSTTTDGVRATFSRLQQVITNLVHNAIHAMPDGGVLKICIRDAAPSVILEVHDTGVGIPGELVGRIFEPFYSTRSRAEGSGMGLAVVHGIVRSLGGEIEVTSAVGEGSVFSLRLPRATVGPGVPIIDVGSDSKARGQGERIAVIDDEPAVARAVAGVLRARGFTVETFQSGAAALAALESGAWFDALVCDVMMPDLDGPTTIEEARMQRPDLPAVLISGFVGLKSAQRQRPLPRVRWLSKPVSADVLVGAVLDAMGSKIVPPVPPPPGDEA